VLNFPRASNDDEREKRIAKIFKEICVGLRVLSDAKMPHTDLLNPNIMVRKCDSTAVLIDCNDNEAGNSLDNENQSKEQFAILLYEFLFKKRFHEQNPEELKETLSSSTYPENFKSILGRCLSSKNVS
jgi:hypothetical protein